MRELTMFVGGSVGSDPYAARTWSGSSRFLLEALGRHNLLETAIGLKLTKLQQYALLLKNFSPSRPVWRKNFYLDPGYRKALTETARHLPIVSPCCLQIGAMFSLPQVFPNKRCISYHDGNLPETLASGLGMSGVSRNRIDQALRYEEESAQQMTAIFTFSEYLRQSFVRDYRVSPEKVFVTGAGINLDRIPEPDPTKDYSNKKVLFIGVDFTRKGGPQLLEAFAIVRQSHPLAELHIVGPARMNEVPRGVVFHGYLAKSDPLMMQKLETLLRESSLFVMPSLYEPFGIASLEAMAYGLPCLVTDGWALREQVTPGVNGALAAKGSVEDLAAKLNDLLSDPRRMAAMGARAREIVVSQYTWDAVAGRMLPHLRK